MEAKLANLIETLSADYAIAKHGKSSVSVVIAGHSVRFALSASTASIGRASMLKYATYRLTMFVDGVRWSSCEAGYYPGLQAKKMAASITR